MNATVEVSIPVDAETAAALSDLRNREAVGRFVSRILREQPSPEALDRAMERLEASSLSPGFLVAGLGGLQTRRMPTAEELFADYAAMAADEEAETEALGWIESLVGDVATEPSSNER